MADNESEITEEEAPEGAPEEAPAEGEGVEEGLEEVAAAAQDVAQAVSDAASQAHGSATLDFIMDVNLQVTVEVGRARMTIQDLLQLGQGSVVELEKLAGEPLDVYLNGKRVARGEAVILNEKFGVRLTEIISPHDRVTALAEAAQNGGE